MVGSVSIAFGNIMDTTQLWHLRLGHISEKVLQELERQGPLCGEKIEKLGICEDCVLGKSKRVKF